VAMALFVVRLPSPGDDRIKGAPTLRLLTPGREAVIGALRPHAQVLLAAGAAGHPYALVLALADEDGRPEVLWPPGAKASGRVGPGAEVVLGEALEVTPGSATLFAFFSDDPLPGDEVARRLAEAVAEARRSGRPLASLDPAPIPGERGRARARLEVAP
jgi:hypothetical protein